MDAVLDDFHMWSNIQTGSDVTAMQTDSKTLPRAHACHWGLSFESCVSAYSATGLVVSARFSNSYSSGTGSAFAVRARTPSCVVSAGWPAHCVAVLAGRAERDGQPAVEADVRCEFLDLLRLVGRQRGGLVVRLRLVHHTELRSERGGLRLSEPSNQCLSC